MSGLGALKRLGEFLMRQSENDERLARAVEQGYDLLNPLVHGTTGKAKLDKKLRPLHTTDEPMLAAYYTGGGRRGGLGRLAKQPVMYPVVTKARIQDTPFDYDTDIWPDEVEWLRELGVKDPGAFQAAVREKNLAGWGPEHPLWHSNTTREGDPWGSSFRSKDFPYQAYPSFFYSFLDRPTFREQLLEEGIEGLRFNHPYADFDISPKGKITETKNMLPGRATFIVDPSKIRSPWAEFKEEGIGLMKKKGGLVK